jgi:hypothetical protein
MTRTHTRTPLGAQDAAPAERSFCVKHLGDTARPTTTRSFCEENSLSKDKSHLDLSTRRFHTPGHSPNTLFEHVRHSAGEELANGKR